MSAATADVGWGSRVIAAAVLLAVVAPLVAAVAASFVSDAPAAEYQHWWGSPRGWQALGRTLRLASLAGLMAAGAGWLLVAAAARCGRAWTMAAVMLSCAAMLVPASLVATAWTVVAAPTHPVGRTLVRLWPGFRLYSLPAAAAILALRYFGAAAAVAWYERLRNDGAAPVERIFEIPRSTRWLHLRLRPALRALAGGAALVILLAMGDHILPGMLLISTYGTQVMIEYVARMNPASAAALAAPPAMVGVVLLLIVRWLVRPGGDSSEPVAGGAEPAGRLARVGGAIVSAAILAAALGVPVWVLARRAGSLAALGEALDTAGAEAEQTLIVASLTAVLCTLAAAFLAAHALRCRRAGRPTAAPLVVGLLAVPASLVAIGVVTLTSRPPLKTLDGTIWPLMFTCAGRFLPVLTLMLLLAWRDERPAGDLAATVHGVGFWRRTWRLTWPRRSLSLLAAAVLAGVLTVTELEASVMLAPPGGSTLAVRLYTLIHTAPDRVVSALTLCILLPAAAGIGLLMATVAILDRRRRA